jgi:hypothetical protein
MKQLSPYRYVLSSVPCHRMTGKQSSIPGGDSQAQTMRRYAVPQKWQQHCAMWLLDQMDERASHSCGGTLHGASVTESIRSPSRTLIP